MGRSLGLPDQPGRPIIDSLTRFIADRNCLVVLDNCEHLLAATATLATALLAANSQLTLLATSREPLPVRCAVGVAALAVERMRVEVTALAYAKTPARPT